MTNIDQANSTAKEFLTRAIPMSDDELLQLVTALLGVIVLIERRVGVPIEAAVGVHRLTYQDSLDNNITMESLLEYLEQEGTNENPASV